MTDPEQQPSRLRFADYEFERYPDSRCRVRVRLEWTDGTSYSGEAEGTDTFQGRIRLGATACLKAAQQHAEERILLELRGAKAVRAFDQWVVVVSLRGRAGEERYQFLGSFAAPDEDVARGAVLSVLDATNRALRKQG